MGHDQSDYQKLELTVGQCSCRDNGSVAACFHLITLAIVMTSYHLQTIQTAIA